MRYLTFLFGIALFTQCVTPTSLANHHAPALRLSDLPTLPHNRPVSVFLQESLPQKPYIEVFYLKAVGQTHETYGQITERLKDQAAKNGVDAVIVQQQGLVENRTWDAFSQQEVVTMTKEIVGTGVIFSENLDFVTKIPKKVETYKPKADKETLELVCTSMLDLLGNKVRQTNPCITFLDYDRVLKMGSVVNRENTFCTFNKNGQLLRKVEKSSTGTSTNESAFVYDSLGRVQRVVIAGGLELQDTYGVMQSNSGLLMKYDEQGRLYERDAKMKDGIVLREIFKFDAAGRVIESNLYAVSGEKLTLILRFLFTEFYTVEEIKQLYPERGTTLK